MLRERVERFRLALDEAIAGLGEEIRLPSGAADDPSEGGALRPERVRDAVDAISRGSSQRDILAALLRGAAICFARAAIFIMKNGRLSGWAGLGFGGAGGFKDDAVPRVSFAAAGDHILARALESGALAESGSEGPGTEPIAALGGVYPPLSAAVPLMVRGKPAAVVYADSGQSGTIGEGVMLEVLARVASLAIERISAADSAGRGRAAEVVAGGTHHARSSAGAIPVSRPGTPTPPEEAEIHALLGDITASPRRAGSDDGLSEEARRMQSDARRLAKLLVSELVLYNEEAVVLGRKNRDLYRRLRKEIDRSRQTYRARVPKTPGPTDYFDEELIRVLAQGDPALMGS